MPTLQQSDFDTAILGFPWYRMGPAEHPDLEQHVRSVRAVVPDEAPRAGIDTKLPAADLQLRERLTRVGFNEVCMQLRWERALSPEDSVTPAQAVVLDRLQLDDPTLLQHARGFIYDRFHQDGAFPPCSADTIFLQWIRNSMSGTKLVSRCADGFCTLAIHDGLAVIDLVSVLTPGRGTCTRVVREAIAESARRDAHTISVITEAANERAWRIYQRLGFRLAAAIRIMHLHIMP
jgi:hypothetical protein